MPTAPIVNLGEAKYRPTPIADAFLRGFQNKEARRRASEEKEKTEQETRDSNKAAQLVDQYLSTPDEDKVMLTSSKAWKDNEELIKKYFNTKKTPTTFLTEEKAALVREMGGETGVHFGEEGKVTERTSSLYPSFAPMMAPSRTQRISQEYARVTKPGGKHAGPLEYENDLLWQREKELAELEEKKEVAKEGAKVVKEDTSYLERAKETYLAADKLVTELSASMAKLGENPKDFYDSRNVSYRAELRGKITGEVTRLYNLALVHKDDKKASVEIAGYAQSLRTSYVKRAETTLLDKNVWETRERSPQAANFIISTAVETVVDSAKANRRSISPSVIEGVVALSKGEWAKDYRVYDTEENLYLAGEYEQNIFYAMQRAPIPGMEVHVHLKKAAKAAPQKPGRSLLKPWTWGRGGSAEASPQEPLNMGNMPQTQPFGR